MADDKMIFPIGFDLEKGVEEASKDWDKYAKKLETALAKRAVKVKIGFDLDKKLDTLDDVKKKLSELKIEPITPENKAALRELIRELKELAKIMEKVSSLKGIELPELQAAKAAKMRKEVEQADEKLRLAQERVRQAQERLTLSQKRAEMQAYKTSQAYHDQDGYVSRLLKRMAVYAAYSGVNTFLTSVREVTAQFELQRISLGAIIQDQQRANQIFAEIKSFALTSPLKILDLTKYTKQMAAYGFAADQVFDVTKRLADISVGLGVDMGRLSLAVSQIKAATVLKSSELRQLTETGLPMLDLLSKKLTETQGKIITTADVMDLISKRAISYEMVEEILYDLTDAGGMFYNMQIKQSQTLFGMWSKLGDAAAIMYDQIGNTQGVNEGMKTLIHTLELLMRNWKDTARIIDVAVGSMAVYALGLKNAAISTKALAGSTALLNLAHKQQVIQTPKIVAAIIGQNLATKASTNLTRLHTAAVLRQATATNILTSTFWKLTAAMLANPWVAAAAAITAVGLALFHFIGNSETAAERAEKLNNSVAALKNLDDTITPMIDTYNELINKTERTAEEAKKLSEVTHELAKRYPGAITAIGDFGEQIDLVADKLNKLYQAEKQARMDSLVYEFGKTEQKIKETEVEIEKLQQQLASGKKTEKSQVNGSPIFRTVALTEEDKYNIIKQIDELRYGTDGQGGLVGLKQSAEAAEAAMKGITIDELHIEKFGAWKKTFTTFRKQVGDVRVQLFDDSTINQFSSLEEALKKTAEEYKKNIALVKTYDDVLKSTTLTADERAKIEGERAEADAMATLAKKALDYYNTLYTAFDKNKGGRKSDPRLQNLKEEISLTKKLYDEYHKLEKQIGATKAAEKIQQIYSNTIKTLQERAGKYGFEFELPFADANLKANMQHFIDKMKELQKLKDKKGKPLFPNIGKEIDEAVAQLEDVDFNSLQKQLEKKLKELADRISRTKTAKEFYEKILSQTGDIQLAVQISTAIYGEDGVELRRRLAEQIREYFQNDRISVDIPIDVIGNNDRINYKRLGEFADQMKEKLGDDSYKALRKIAEDGQKDLAKTWEGYFKDIEKAESYAAKRIKLAQTTADKIAAIRADMEANPELRASGEKLIAGFIDKEMKEAAKLEWDAFKGTPLYVQMFEDLEHASTSTLEMMRQRLAALSRTWGSALDPTQLKEMQGRMNEITEQLRTRNPWKSLKEAYAQYKAATVGVTLAGAAHNAGKASKDFYDASVAYGADSVQAKAAERELKSRERIAAIVRQITDEQGKQVKGQQALELAQQKAFDQAEIARGHLEIANAELIAAKEKAETMGKDTATDPDVIAAQERVKAAQVEVDLTERVSEILDENAKKSKTLKESLIGAAQNVTQFMQAGADIAKAVGDTIEALGGDENDVQYFNDIAEALGNITAGFQGIIDSALALNVGGIISNAVGVIPNMVKGFVGLFSAGKVRKANKEIKRQAELLDQLEYTYDRLQNAADKLFGADYINNYNQQVRTLEAQQEAYLKQAAAERSKGKKADEEKIKEYENAARDTADAIRDMEADLTAHFTGTTRTDAAREFARSWIEARATLANTFDAIKGDYTEMIRNMIVEGAAAKVIDNALAPLWKNMDELLGKNDITGAIDYMIQGMDGFLSAADNGMEVLWQSLEAKGYDMKKLLGDSSTNLTGISRDIATASEERINGLAAGINTQNYYISQQLGEVRLIRQLMEGDGVIMGTGGGVDTTALWNQHLELQRGIYDHTRRSAEQCEAMAIQCAAIAADLHRVIVPKGGVVTHAVVTRLTK